jgi:hypothetical protein
LLDYGDALRLWIWQRDEENSVDGAEDRRAYTDPEPNTEDSNERTADTRAAEQLAPRVPKVCEPSLHDAP